MASIRPTTSASAQQPGLSSFLVCDRLPEGCVTYPVLDRRHEPLLKVGEWVIVDPEDREPRGGELFVIQWQSGGAPSVVELQQMRSCSLWAVGARHRGTNAKALVFGQPGEIVGDFGYRSEQLAERLLGRVVGILEPAFDAPTREIA